MIENGFIRVDSWYPSISVYRDNTFIISQHIFPLSILRQTFTFDNFYFHAIFKHFTSSLSSLLCSIYLNLIASVFKRVIKINFSLFFFTVVLLTCTNVVSCLNFNFHMLFFSSLSTMSHWLVPPKWVDETNCHFCRKVFSPFSAKVSFL